ncbi:phage tail tape measure protein [Pseudomonas sp. RIT-PI-AD]|uniref:phage tail tape measure protein n=1 Tax=Pseudomonas sp. RIT-PI-AD TaxID=3035294 RepID=UPI0021DA3C90|nr:phage tail tape measure protein [Pseudomonas sp. RIT-PI-AD]
MNKLQLQVLLSALDKASGPLKKIQGSGIGAAKELKAARERLKELNRTQADVSAWRTQRAAAAQTAAALQAAQAKAADLSRQLAATATPTRALTRSFQAAVREAQALKRTHQQQAEGLQQLRTRLAGAGINTRELVNHERALRGQITATNASIKTQTDRLAAIARQRERLARAKDAYAKGKERAGSVATAGAAGVGVAYAASRPVLGVAKSYIEFEDAMMGVAKQVDGARDDNGKLTATYYDMAAEIRAMTAQLPIATTEFAALVEAQARAGIQGKDNLMSMAKVAATAAVAFELPAEQVGEDLGRIAGLYKVPIANIGQLGDALNYLDDNTRSKGGDIIETLTRMSDVADKLDYRKAAALGSTFLSLGSAPETAASAARAMVRELSIASAQSKTFQQGMKMLKLDSDSVQKKMSTDAMGTILSVLQRIQTLPMDKQTEVATRIFGKEFGKDAAKLVNNMDELKRQLGLVNDEAAKGSMWREMDVRAEALSGRLQILQNRFFNLEITLGGTLRASMVDLLEWIGGILEKVGAWAQANPALVSGILKVLAVTAALAAAFGGLALTLASFLGPFAMVRYAMTLFGIATTAATWPVLAIIAAVAALAAGAYLLYRNWDSVSAFFQGLWLEIKAGFSGGVGGILKVLANFSPVGMFYRAFALVMGYLGVDLPAKFTDAGGMLIGGLVSGIKAKLGAVKDAISNVGAATIGWFKEKLDIHSPSRVFAELGGYTMQGLTVGLAKGADGPLAQVNGLAQRLSAAGAAGLGELPALAAGIRFDSRPPVGSSQAAAYDSHDTYHIHISAGAGGDPQAIARAVQAELARIERQQAARRRGRIGDLD